MEQNKEITITYETLFELFRREKDREDLQKLEDSFFNDVVGYLSDKNKSLQTDGSQFSIEEKEKTRAQLENIKKIISGIYERREKKIVRMALDKSRIKSNIIDTSSMLKEERMLFDRLFLALDNGRGWILNNLLEAKMPEFVEENKEEVKHEEKKDASGTTKLVRFLRAVPKFVGRELEEYGPFDEEDVASLPFEIANVLINKGRVEEIGGE